MAPSPAHRGVESNNHRPYRVRQLIQFGGHRAAFSLAHAHAHRLVLRVKLCLDCRLELYKVLAKNLIEFDSWICRIYGRIRASVSELESADAAHWMSFRRYTRGVAYSTKRATIAGGSGIHPAVAHYGI